MYTQSMDNKPVIVKARLDADLTKQYRAFVKSRGWTDTEIVRTAVKRFLDDESESKMLFRSIASMQRRIGDQESKMTLLVEVFLLYLETWFAFMPDPSTLPEGKLTMGRAAYNDFFEDLRERLKAGGIVGEKLSDFFTTLIKENQS